MNNMQFEYASVVRYMKPARKDGSCVDYTDQQIQAAVTQEFGKQTAALSNICTSLQDGGWYLNSHSFTQLPDGVLMISYILQRPKRT